MFNQVMVAVCNVQGPGDWNQEMTAPGANLYTVCIGGLGCSLLV